MQKFKSEEKQGNPRVERQRMQIYLLFLRFFKKKVPNEEYAL